VVVVVVVSVAVVELGGNFGGDGCGGGGNGDLSSILHPAPAYPFAQKLHLPPAQPSKQRHLPSLDIPSWHFWVPSKLQSHFDAHIGP
jgi:hypothetical protein